MNAPLRRVAVVMVAMFGVLMIALTVIQYGQAPSLNADTRNVRSIYAENGRNRGPILVAGEPVAESVPVDSPYRYLRTYPQGPLYAPVTGYSSVVFGRSGIERAENEVLNGSASVLWRQRLIDLVTGRSTQGGSVELTIDPAVQRAAYDALGGREGAVVALDTETGAVLALVSTPSFDPNVLAGHDTAEVDAAWKELLADPGAPLENRAIAGKTYAPGSTFKLIDVAALLSTGEYTPETRVPAPDAFQLPGSSKVIHNPGGERCDDGETATLQMALRKSCNTPFAALMIELGPQALKDQAAKFGFGSPLDIPLPVTPSRLGDELDVPSVLGQSAIGQQSVRVTPMQMAMVAAGIANDGVVMKPYLVATERDANLSVVATTSPRELSTAVTPEVAEQIKGMMVDVVANGTGRAAAIPGVTVAGKTGTAESGVDDGTAASNPHAWMVAFAPAEAPRVAVAALVVNGGTPGQGEYTGAQLAGPIVRSVLQAALEADS